MGKIFMWYRFFAQLNRKLLSVKIMVINWNSIHIDYSLGRDYVDHLYATAWNQCRVDVSRQLFGSQKIAVPRFNLFFDRFETETGEVQRIKSLFEIGSCFKKINTSDYIIPVTFTSGMVNVSKIGVSSSFKFEEKTVTFEGPDGMSITVTLKDVYEQALPGVVEDNLIPSKEDILIQGVTSFYVITELLVCNSLSISFKIGPEEFTKEVHGKNVVGFRLNKFSVSEEGNLYPTPPEPQMLETEVIGF